jgi:hypothetical protein
MDHIEHEASNNLHCYRNMLPTSCLATFFCAFTHHCLVTVSNSGHCSSTVFASLLAGDWLITNEAKSKSHYNRWSVSKSVLVSSPIWSTRPDFCYCETAAVLLMWGDLSDERTSLSFVAVTISIMYIYIYIYINFTCRDSYWIVQLFRSLWTLAAILLHDF